MNFKTTLALVLVLLVLGGLWLFLPSRESATVEPNTPATASHALFDPEPRFNDITRITLARPDAPTLVFEREAREPNTPGTDDWRIAEPIQAPAEAARVRGLAQSLLGLEAIATLQPGHDGEVSLADAQLDPPLATIRLTTATGSEIALAVGGKVVMSDNTYVQVPGEKTVQVVRRDIARQLRKDVNDYRATRLIPFDAPSAQRLDVEHDGTRYTLVRTGNDWLIESPVRAYADAAKVRTLLSKISAIRADEFVADNPSSLLPYGLQTPALQIAVTTEHAPPALVGPESQPASAPAPERTTQRVAFGSPVGLGSDQQYALIPTPPTVVKVPQPTVSAVIPDLNDLRDPRIVRFPATDVTWLELETGGTRVTLEKRDGTWLGTDGPVRDVEPGAVQDFIDAIVNLRALTYADNVQDWTPFGLATPKTIIRVTASGLVEPIMLRVGGETESGRNVYVRRNDETSALVVSAALAARLEITPLTLRSRDILTVPQDRIVGVVQEGLDRAVERHANNRWVVTEPAGCPISMVNVTRLTRNLARLRAVDVVGRDDAAKYGLAHPQVVLRFTVADAPPTTQPADTQPATTTHTLRLAETDGTPYAQLDDAPYVFKLDGGVYDALTAELIDPQLFQVSADEINAVTVQTPAQTLALERKDGSWSYTPEPYVALDQTLVMGLARDLAALQATRYLAYDPAAADAIEITGPTSSITLHTAKDAVFTLTFATPVAGEAQQTVVLQSPHRVFTLPRDLTERLLRGLDAYLAPENAKARK